MSARRKEAAALVVCLLAAGAFADEPPGGPQVRGAVEAVAESFAGGLYAGGTPVLGLESGDDFSAELGATLRFRLLSGGESFRRADWDEPSDFGQILRELRIGKD